jgi:hypothetical protein
VQNACCCCSVFWFFVCFGGWCRIHGHLLAFRPDKTRPCRGNSARSALTRQIAIAIPGGQFHSAIITRAGGGCQAAIQHESQRQDQMGLDAPSPQVPSLLSAQVSQ